MEEQSKKPKQEMSWGCALFIFGFGVTIFLIIGFATGKFGEIMDSFEEDDDCNSSYIEEDYNGDGEEDAEDLRIQISGC